jgi:hypothetical protein
MTTVATPHDSNTENDLLVCASCGTSHDAAPRVDREDEVLCPTCNEQRRHWKPSQADLRVRLERAMGKWSAHWAALGLSEQDANGLAQMVLEDMLEASREA